MKKIFTIALVLMAAVSFSQRGAEFSAPLELTGKVVSHVEKTMAKDSQVLLPGNWASVNQVGTYRWGTAEPYQGWIFGNNNYGAVGAGAKFNVAEPKEVVGAYFWISSLGAADYDVVFGVYEFAAGAVGSLVASVTVAREDIVVYATGTGITPDMYTNAFYVTFDTPVEVTGDFFLGFDASEVTWAVQGDGVALASALIDQGGGGAGIAYILHDVDGWEPATVWNAVLDLDIGIFAVVQDAGPHARIQIIHNSADAAVDEVDIFVNGDLFLSDFAFRTATPFVSVPAGVDLDIIVAPAGAGIGSGVGPVTVNLTEGETYIAIANGIVSATGYDPATAFSLDVFPTGREAADVATNTDVLVFHGSTDAPTVSVWETGVGAGELFTFSYGEFAGYLELGTDDYVLEVRTADGATTVVAYSAPLSTLGLDGAAITVVASGFLDPANNSNGEAFGLYVALASGGDLIPLPIKGDGFTVTFNVDMNDVEGFDPATHEVWVTGNFAGWSEPGTGNSVQMALAPPAKEATVIYEEGFEPANDTGALPDGWTQKKANNAIGNDLVDLATGDRQWFRYSEQYYPYETFNATWTRTGEASMHINWNVEPEQNVYAITPVINLPAADAMTLEFWMYFSSAWHTELNILLELDGTWEVLSELNSTANANLYASAVTIDLTGKVGAARIAFVYKWTDGIQMNIDDISIYGTGGQSDDLTYTATVENVEAGELLYKYFSDAFGEGWDGGEWTGDPNRSVMIEEDTVLNNVWGDLVVGVDEIILDMVTRVYPNPVRNTLFIQSGQQIDHVRMFDMAGRVVFQAEVRDFETTIDVNQLRGGLYILQMISGQQVKTHKIQVVK